MISSSLMLPRVAKSPYSRPKMIRSVIRSSLPSRAAFPSLHLRAAKSSNLAANINARIATNFKYPISTPRPFSAAVDKESTNVTCTAGESQSTRKPTNTLESLPVTFADISRANVAIRNGVIRTQCKKSYFLSELLGANIWLKTEFQQFTGSFKERGARNAILSLLREQGDELKKKGVIAASAGNHALALAYHGKDLGVPVTVVMPTVAPLAKVDKCRVSFVSF